MSIQLTQFNIRKSRALRVRITGRYTSGNTAALRAIVEQDQYRQNRFVYIDTVNLEDIDLAGVNELIHVHQQLHGEGRVLVVVYQRHSPMETWILRTGLDGFMETGIVRSV